jgi:hypothetical protein
MHKGLIEPDKPVRVWATLSTGPVIHAAEPKPVHPLAI